MHQTKKKKNLKLKKLKNYLSKSHLKNRMKYLSIGFREEEIQNNQLLVEQLKNMKPLMFIMEMMMVW